MTDAQRRAKRKYDAKAYSTIACKLKKSTAARFKEYAAEKGVTPSTVLREHIKNLIGDE